MKFDVLTLFPEMFEPIKQSIIAITIPINNFLFIYIISIIFLHYTYYHIYFLNSIIITNKAWKFPRLARYTLFGFNLLQESSQDLLS